MLALYAMQREDIMSYNVKLKLNVIGVYMHSKNDKSFI